MINEAFLLIGLFTILTSLQVIHCGQKTVEENGNLTDLKVTTEIILNLDIFENRTSNRPAAFAIM